MKALRVRLLGVAAAILLIGSACAAFAQTSKPVVLALYSSNVEGDHVDFAKQAIAFYTRMAAERGFTFEASTDWEALKTAQPSQTRLILWLNDSPHSEEQRRGFERYMEAGGAWLGFHAAGYNDAETHWPWFVKFFGGAVFYSNNWPPLPADLTVDDGKQAITQGLPHAFRAPANEWYIWKPNPRGNPKVRVLLTLDPGNYPLGLKDTLTAGDLPVVWTNTDYRMIYMNMGHGDKIFDSPTQNRLFENAVLWLIGPRAK